MLIKNKYYEIKVKLETNKNTNMNLEYYLLESKYNIEDNNENINTYGVKIVKKENSLDNITNIEQNEAYHISINKEKVENLLKCLSNNCVTPMGLTSVLDNLLGVSY